MLQEGNLSDFEQRFHSIAGKQSMNQTERGKSVGLARKSALPQFGNNRHAGINRLRRNVVQLFVGTHFQIARPYPAVRPAEHRAQFGQWHGTPVGSDPPLHDFGCSVHGLASDLAIGIHVEEAQYLKAFAGHEDAEIGTFGEDTFAGLHDLQLGTAMRTGTTAQAVGQRSVALPRVAALRAGNNAFGGSAADVVEAMTAGIGFLRFGDAGQTAAQTGDFFLYFGLGFHGVLLLIRIIGSFAGYCRSASWRQACAG